jgi:hypothetical protein
MSRAELTFRTRAAIRTRSHRLAVSLRGTAWNRSDIRQALTPALRSSPMRAAIGRRDWDEVQQRLEAAVRGRPCTFVLDPAGAPAMRATIRARWPGAPAHAAARADAIAAGRYALLGYRDVSFARNSAAVDWHYDPVHGRGAPRRFWADVPYLDPSCGDHKIIWELNRHQHFLALGRALWLTGDRRYGDLIVSQIRSWLASNPPLVGVNWASMLELALRSLSWVWAVHFLLGSTAAGDEPRMPDDGAAHTSPWLVDVLLGLDRQLSQVEANLSYYFSPNTHLTGEALALYVTGVALPELARSSRRAALGRRILLRERDRQICADGGHMERSTHYHRYTLDFYLLALLTAERAGDIEAADLFRESVGRLAAFMQAMASTGGRIPLIGDDDGGMLWPITDRDPRDVRDSLALAHLLAGGGEPVELPEEAFWLAQAAAFAGESLPAAAPAAPPGVDTRTFPDSGYVTARSGGDHLVFDVGPHGYLNGGHAHADALAITLVLDNRPLLIDPGTATYTMDSGLRDAMRESASHNTLTIDARSSAVPAGPFRWRSRADARLETERRTPGFLWAEACHDGYAPVLHRRSVVHAIGCGWLVIDEVAGGAGHLVQQHWHFDPDWTITSDGTNRLEARHADGARAWLLRDGGELRLTRGDRSSPLGWCSPRYGLLTPAWSARLSRTVVAPATLTAWVGGGDGGPPFLESVPVRADTMAAATCVRISSHHGACTTLVRSGDVPVRETRSADTADYHTDARLLQYASGPGRLQLSLADARAALARGGDGITVTAEGAIRELHVSIRGDRLDIWSAAPPEGLRLQHPALRAVTTAYLNGSARGLGRRHVHDSNGPGRPARAAARARVRADAGFHAPGGASPGRRLQERRPCVESQALLTSPR